MYNQNNNNQVMGYLCSSKNIENFYENNRGEYDKDTYYKKGDQVTFMGKKYEVQDQATQDGAKNYQPDVRPNVWKVVNNMEYDPNKYYKKDDIVTYNGRTYKVIDQATQDGAKNYQPDVRPNVWKPVM
jgi:signal peptidase I